MKVSRMIRLACIVSITALYLPAAALCGYRKLDPPPDVDKDYPNNSCWLATAANMLAGAGYGENGSGQSDIQLRAKFIYDELVDYFGVST